MMNKGKKFFINSALVCACICIIFLALGYLAKYEPETEQQGKCEENIKSFGEQVNKLLFYDIELSELGVVLSKAVVENEQLADIPWVKDRVQLPNSQTIVSLDKLRQTIYIYNIFNTQEGKEPLDLTAEDVISLCYTPNPEKRAEFNKLALWYGDWFSFSLLHKNRETLSPNSLYAAFTAAAYNHYKEKHGKPFIDKSRHLYTAEEKYALVKWEIENVDYDYLAKIISNYKSNEEADYYGIESFYYRFLLQINVITEIGTPR